MRLMTMNVLAPQYADGASRRAVLAREIRHQDPDVLALQEVTREDWRPSSTTAGTSFHTLAGPPTAWGPYWPPDAPSGTP